MSARQYVADDTATISQRLKELQDERTQAIIGKPEEPERDGRPGGAVAEQHTSSPCSLCGGDYGDGNNLFEIELLTTQFTTKMELFLQQKISKLLSSCG